MKAITSGIRNWQTTVIGVVLAILIVIQSNDITNWEEWIVPALIAGLGVLSRDANKTSENSGLKVLLCLLALTPLLLTSCGNQNYAYEVDTRTYEDQIKTHPEKVTVGAEHVRPIGGYNFQISGGAKVIGDGYEIDLTETGIDGTVVVDLRSQK